MTGHGQAREAVEVAGVAGGLGHEGVVLVVGVASVQGRRAGVLQQEESLREALYPLQVVDAAEMAGDDGAGGEGGEEGVPQQNDLAAQLGDVAVGDRKELLLAVKGLENRWGLKSEIQRS